jgi:hypothetical protein
MTQCVDRLLSLNVRDARTPISSASGAVRANSANGQLADTI